MTAERTGYLCFIRAGQSTDVNIGQCEVPEERLHDLDASNPRELHLEAVIPGGKTLEAALHAHLAPRHLKLGWFELSTEEVAEIVGRAPGATQPTDRRVEARDDERRRRWGPAVVLGIVLAVAGAAFSLEAPGLRSSKTTRAEGATDSGSKVSGAPVSPHDAAVAALRKAGANARALGLKKCLLSGKCDYPVEAYLDAARTGPERRRLSASAERWKAAAVKAAQH